MNWISQGSLCIAAVIHFLPLTGILGKPMLEKLYGLEMNDNNLLILMQHRALLFGILGVLFVAAVFKADMRVLAMVLGLLSTAGFVWIAWVNAPYNELILRVVKADLLVIVALLAGLGNEWWKTWH